MPPKMQERRKYLSAGGKHDEKTAPKRGGRGCLEGPAIQDGNKSLPALASNAPPLRPEVEAFTPEICREAIRMGSSKAEPLALGRHESGVSGRGKPLPYKLDLGFGDAL